MRQGFWYFFNRILAAGILSVFLFIPTQVAGQPGPHGDFGFRVEQDTGAYPVVWQVSPESLAWQNGLRPGHRLVAWNKMPIEEALRKIEIPESLKEISPRHHPLIARHLLTRSSADSTAEIFYFNEADNLRGIRIKTLPNSDVYPDLPEYLAGLKEPMSSQGAVILHDSILLWRPEGLTKRAFGKALRSVKYKQEQVAGLIIDLRTSSAPTPKANLEAPGIPTTIFAGPMTSGQAESWIREVQGREHVLVTGHAPTRGSVDLAGVHPDILLSADPLIRIEYAYGRDVLREEAVAHLYRLMLNYQRNR